MSEDVKGEAKKPAKGKKGAAAADDKDFGHIVAEVQGVELDADGYPTYILNRHALSDTMEVWSVPIEVLHGQPTNARYMTKQTMTHLRDNVLKRGELESLPLCAWAEQKLQIISGHHRLKAAKAAGLTSVWAMVDVSGLGKDAIRAKQLAHNSIQGVDDETLVQKIFQEIGDVALRLEAYIEESKVGAALPITSLPQLSVNLKTRTIAFGFAEADEASLAEMVSQIKMLTPDHLYLATSAEYAAFTKVLQEVREKTSLQAIPGLVFKLVEYAQKGMAAEAAE